MKRAVLYTGTFDPFHLGHVWQLEKAHQVLPFERVVVAVNADNPQKPNALPITDRMNLAHLMLRDRQFPFKVVIEALQYNNAEDFKSFVALHLKGFTVVRTVGSDRFHEFVHTQHGREYLAMFEHIVTMHPTLDLATLQAAIDALPADVHQKIAYKIVGSGSGPGISATEVRKDITRALERGHISAEQFEYCQKHQLYGLGSEQD